MVIDPEFRFVVEVTNLKASRLKRNMSYDKAIWLAQGKSIGLPGLISYETWEVGVGMLMSAINSL